MLPSDLVKIATNAWTRQLMEGSLSQGSVERLTANDLLSPQVAPAPSRGQLGQLRLPQFHTDRGVPLQSPGVGLPERAWQTQKALWDMQTIRMRVGTAPRQAPAVSILDPRQFGIGDSHFGVTKGPGGVIHIPPRHRTDFPGIHRSTLAHERGHAADHARGPHSRGYYDLNDRLLFHKLEKRAPGILFTDLIRPSTNLSEAWAENMGQLMRNPTGRESSRLNRVLSHLRNNYKVKVPYTGNALLGRALTLAHGIPLAAQSRLIEPARNGRLLQGLVEGRPGGSVVAQAAKLLSRFRR